MIRSLRIDDFRAFKRLEMNGVGRVNLLVGRNNSGKTSVLEAVQFLASQGDPYALWETMSRRGERITDPDDRGTGPQADVSHLFHGHHLEPGRTFQIWQKNGGEPESVTVRVGMPDSEDDISQVSLFGSPDGEMFDRTAPDFGLRLLLEWQCGKETVRQALPLLRTPGHVAEDFALPSSSFRRQRPRGAGERPPVRFVTTAALGRDRAISMWSSIAATEHEEESLSALQLIEPKIERIVAVPSSGPYYRDGLERGGFVVRVAGVVPRVPIGSMGDGVWRMLGLSMSLSTAAGGLLLVDEIDTGLHYTVMRDMWRLVLETAERLDVQVFATTHSFDCWLSLASVIEAKPALGGDVAVHRIEAESEEPVTYPSGELVAAARRELEIR